MAPDDPDAWRRLQDLPSMDEDPLVWDHRAGGFVRGARDAAPPPAAPAPAPPAPAPPAAEAGGIGVGGRRHVVIGPAPAAGVPPAAPAAPAAPSPPAPAGRGGGVPPVAPPRPATGRAPKAPKGPRPPRAHRRRWPKRVALAVVLVPLLLASGVLAFAWWKFEQIPRVEVGAVLSPPSAAGTNYLVVGTDSREGISKDDPNAGAFIGESVSGARTDTIMVLRVDGSGQHLLSLPRDLWVRDPKTGEMGRINATYNAGPANLIKAVQSLGIPVQHYLEINFVSFGRLVDAVGGIDVEFAAPARDANSGLNITSAGVQHLDGTQALAYVRARHYEELVNGKWRLDPTSDLGRVQRQRTFLAALVGKITGSRNPIELIGISGATSAGMRIDDRLGFFEAIGLAWQLRGFSPTSESLPVKGRTTSGGADVLDLQQPAAKEMIARYA